MRLIKIPSSSRNLETYLAEFGMAKITTKYFCSILLVPVILFSLGACAKPPQWVAIPRYTPADPAEVSSKASSSGFSWKNRPTGEIAPGYLLSIRSPDPKVNGEYRVEFDNVLKLPYNVRVNSAGLNEEQLTDAIRSSYQAYFRFPKDIKVSVVKKEYLVDAQGLVKKPGRFLLKQDSSLDEIIAQAGGLQEGNGPNNVPQYARISGPTGSGVVRLADYYSGTKGLTPSWQGGEVVFFQTEGSPLHAANQADQNTVHLLGEVKNPAEYGVADQADFFTYLIKAGGPTDRADLANVTLIRSEGKQSRALNFSMLDTTKIPQILPGDAIILNSDNSSPLEKNSRVGASFANIVSALGIIAIAAL